MGMTKSDLVEKLSESLTNLTMKECEVIVDTVFHNMKDALQRGEKIEIRGFGSFTVRVRRAKEGRNPKTGERCPSPRSGSRFSRSARNSGKWSTGRLPG
jgi:integration host factor subunit beta